MKYIPLVEDGLYESSLAREKSFGWI